MGVALQMAVHRDAHRHGAVFDFHRLPVLADADLIHRQQAVQRFFQLRLLFKQAFKPVSVSSSFRFVGAAGTPAAKAVIGSIPSSIHRESSSAAAPSVSFLLAFGFSSLSNKTYCSAFFGICAGRFSANFPKIMWRTCANPHFS